MSIWNKIKRIDSTDENVAKFVFEKDNAVAEAVLYKYPTYEERTVICCSTQSGNLTSEQIVNLPVHVLAELKIDSDKIKDFKIMYVGNAKLNHENYRNAILALSVIYPKATVIRTMMHDYFYRKIHPHLETTE